MKLIQSLLVVSMFFIVLGCKNQEQGEISMDKLIDSSITASVAKYKLLGAEMRSNPELLPRTIDENGKIITANSAWWTSGFFPGTLWYLYEYSNDSEILELAREMTLRVEDQQYTTDNHDVGFMIFCSFGNGNRLTNESTYEGVIETAAGSLSTRFNEEIGLIQSWEASEKWQYPVIIDNMMNLELLTWVSKNMGDSTYMKVAIEHADNTIKNHYRDNYSSYHVISFDTATAEIHARNTHQGFSDESAWARGQTWGLYGFVMMYRETGLQRYLNQAINVADFLISHPNLPEDKIPFWDFDAPNEERDASAGAIMASALIELSQYVEESKSTKYHDIAEQQLRSLSSDAYFAADGTNGNFILMHSVGSKPHNSEMDVPLTYADYYFIEALLRYKNLILKK